MTLWFCQLESKFEPNKIIRDTTKYCYVVPQLDIKFAQGLENIVGAALQFKISAFFAFGPNESVP